ncbi:MAG: DUF1853 family protein [Alphaproteobacteria bacterium]|nr:MAG: DUF1853 family protein [Alphaproteobacteria bacterium]
MREIAEKTAADYLRDLRFVISAPFLLKKKPEPDLAGHPETAALLSALEEDAAPLLIWFADGPPRRLGHYFERLVVFWLRNLPSVEIIAANLPLYEEKRTIGEIDLLFRFENVLYHIELAIKFYLNTGNPTHAAAYVGPMVKDTLKRKLGRLYGHQLPLGQRLAKTPYREELGIAEVPHPFAFVKGMLFQPLAQGFADDLPPGISPECSQGIWCCIRELNEATPLDFTHYRILSRLGWISSPFQPEELTHGGLPQFSQEMAAHIDEIPTPHLAALYQGEREVLRLFVTPDNWLLSAREAHPDEALSDEG